MVIIFKNKIVSGRNNVHMKNGSYLLIDEWKKYGVTAGTTFRTGGYSKETAYRSFNMGMDTDDNPEYIKKNYEKLLSDFGWKDLYTNNRFFHTWQIHRDNIVIVDEKSVEANDSDRYIYGIDGFITSLSGSEKGVITVKTADCQSISIFDKKNRVAGVLHSGWKGTRLKILHRALMILDELYHSSPSDILIYLGPCIRQNNYEVSKDFEKYFDRNLKEINGKYYFDISGENRDIALDYSIPKENIIDCNLCTYENNDLFFSHRRDKGITGRMLTFITID